MNNKHQRESYQDLLKWGREEGGGFRSSSYNIYMNYQTCVYILVISTVQPSFCSSTPNPNVLVYSLLNRVSCVPACQRGLRVNVLVYQKACHFFENCSYKILREISIFCYYILLLYILLVLIFSRFAVKCLNGYFIITCFHFFQKTT